MKCIWVYEGRAEGRGTFPSFCGSFVRRPHSQYHSGGLQWASHDTKPTRNSRNVFPVVSGYHIHTLSTDHRHTHNTLHSSVLYFCCLYRVGFVSFPSLLPCLSFILILNSHTYPWGWTTTWTNTLTCNWIQTRRLLQNLTLMVNTTRWKLQLAHTFTLKLYRESCQCSQIGSQIQTYRFKLHHLKFSSNSDRKLTPNQALTDICKVCCILWGKKDNSVLNIVTTEWGSALQVRCDHAVLMCVCCVNVLCRECALRHTEIVWWSVRP